MKLHEKNTIKSEDEIFFLSQFVGIAWGTRWCILCLRSIEKIPVKDMVLPNLPCICIFLN
ncbi:MAG: hypothetical protein ACTSRZ_19930 [Promethearchaeota archaeon]